MKTLTDQEIFDKVVLRLADGKGRCGVVNSCGNFKCKYVDENDNHCAIGAVLPQEILLLVGESSARVSILMEQFEEVEEFFSDNNSNLLYNLQNAHDLSSNWFEDSFTNWV